jgi:hypothetical protein
MSGALTVGAPKEFLEKLAHDVGRLKGDQNDAYAAIDGLHDAYHLREWIWHDRLSADAALQAAIMGNAGQESDWNAWVNQTFPDFGIIRDLCNSSKHFAPRNQGSVTRTLESGWDKQPWDVLPWGAEGLWVKLTDGRVVSVTELLERALQFWEQLFTKFAL